MFRELRARRALSKPVTINGLKPAEFIKRAYGLGVELDGPGRFDLYDPRQRELRRMKDFVVMAERDALESRHG